MAKVTVADLVERLDAMQEEVDALRAHIDAQATAPSIQYVYELKNREPLPGRLDIRALSAEMSEAYAGYDEYRDVYSMNGYL